MAWKPVERKGGTEDGVMTESGNATGGEGEEG